MKKLLRSTFGTLVVAAFLAMAPPTYARGGPGGGHGGHRGGNGGHGVKHAAAGHVKGGHGAFRVRGGRGRQFVGPARGRARYAGREYYRTRGDRWGGLGRLLRISVLWIFPVSAITAWATAIRITVITVTARWL